MSQSESITEEILEHVVKLAHAAFEAKVAQVGRENFTQFERAVLLQSFDSTGVTT